MVEMGGLEPRTPYMRSKESGSIFKVSPRPLLQDQHPQALRLASSCAKRIMPNPSRNQAFSIVETGGSKSPHVRNENHSG
jgi:hypothetical protein